MLSELHDGKVTEPRKMELIYISIETNLQVGSIWPRQKGLIWFLGKMDFAEISSKRDRIEVVMTDFLAVSGQHGH